MILDCSITLLTINTIDYHFINDVVYIKNSGKILAKALIINNNLKYSSIIKDPYDKTKDFSILVLSYRNYYNH